MKMTNQGTEATGHAICPTCDQGFTKIGIHWSRSGCPYPEPSPEENEIFTGLLMGDGSLATHSSENPYLRWSGISYPFHEFLDDKLGILTTGVKLHRTGEKNGELDIQREDKDWEVNPENYNDIYVTRTRRLPYFRKFIAWYEQGKKRFPDDLDLTPITAKYWYAGDGTVNWMRNSSARIQFVSRNEKDRENFIQQLFSESGFQVKRNRHMYYFSTEESKAVLEWMGDPLPGFEYKWAVDNRENYERLKEGSAKL